MKKFGKKGRTRPSAPHLVSLGWLLMTSASAQAVDARCADRCAALFAAVSACEREHAPAACKQPFQAWRSHCVTNSACNPSGRQIDPIKAERRCAALAKRVAVCEASITGQAQASVTADCRKQRSDYQRLCSSVVVHGEEPDAAERSRAITERYREAAAKQPPQPPQHRGGQLIVLLADWLAGGTAPARAAALAGEHPAAAILTLAALSACLVLRDGSLAVGAQRLMQAHTIPHLCCPSTSLSPAALNVASPASLNPLPCARKVRVYVQGIVVGSTVCVMGVAEALELSRRRGRMEHEEEHVEGASSR